MPRKPRDAYGAGGYTFQFFFDGHQPGHLHIETAHGVTVQDAIDTFFGGWTAFNSRRSRYETFTEAHGLYWTWLNGDDTGTDVLVLSCFTI